MNVRSALQGERPLHNIAVLALYLALAVVATWPLALRAADHVYGLGTPPLNVWAMSWVVHQLPRHPLALFDANAFYPYERSLAFSEHLFVPALLGAPVQILSGNPVLAYNVVALGSLAVAGLGMYLLCRELTGDTVASLAGGALYAFHTWNINELARLQILSSQWFPLLLLALIRFFRAPRLRTALLVGLLYALQGLTCMYWALYLPGLVLLVLVFLQWRHRLGVRPLVLLAACLATALLLTVAFAVPYVQNASELGFHREEPGALPLERYLSVLPWNRVYRGLLPVRIANSEAAHFLGFSSLLLAGIGLLGWRRAVRPDAAPLRTLLLGLAVLGFTLSLGMEVRLGDRVLMPGPYALLYRFVPGFGHVRYPERFSLLLVLGLAPLAAAGLCRLRPLVRGGGVALLAVVPFLENLSAPLGIGEIAPPSRAPEVYQWLAGQDDVRVVAEVPGSHYFAERWDALPMYFSVVHWKRTVQGFTGYFPPASSFVRWRLFHFPEPESVDLLSRLGVDTVVVHAQDGRPSWLQEPRGFSVARAFPDGDVVLRLPAERSPRFALPAEPLTLVPVDRTDWYTYASRRETLRARDGNDDTAWSTVDEQLPGDFYAVRFPREVNLARVSLDVRYPYQFPIGLFLEGAVGEGRWVALPFDARSAYEGLFARLLQRPRQARLDVDVVPRPVRALRLGVSGTDGFKMPWTMSELRVYEPRAAGP